MTFSVLPVYTGCGLRAKKKLCQRAPSESASIGLQLDIFLSLRLNYPSLNNQPKLSSGTGCYSVI